MFCILEECCIFDIVKCCSKKLFNLVIGNSIVRAASKVIALSYFETKQFFPYGINSDKMAVIPNGIAAPPGKYVYIGQEAKSYFLYIGRIEARKNLIFLVEAFKDYANKGGKEKLLFVGPVERGYDTQIQAKITELGMRDQIKVCQPAYGAEKWSYIQNSKAVIYPSYGEPFGRVPFEAVTCSVPCIVPSESGGAEYLGKFLPECIYEQDDLKSLVNSLFKSQKISTQAMNEAKEWVQKCLNWDPITQDVISLYKTLRLTTEEPLLSESSESI